VKDDAPTLSELGIDEELSSRAQICDQTLTYDWKETQNHKHAHYQPKERGITAQALPIIEFSKGKFSPTPSIG
jgi:hypothetical protein